MKAVLTNYRQSPRKVRLVASLIRGKTVAQARKALTVLDKRSAPTFTKLLNSAVANAKQNDNKAEDTLRITDVRIDQGVVFRRFMPRAFGRATVIQKKSSTIKIMLGEQKDSAPKKVIKRTSSKKETNKNKIS